MTKFKLLAAASVAALAFAGAANATEISSAKVSNITLTTLGASKTVFTIANESISATLANRQTTTTAGHNVIASQIQATNTPNLFEPGAGGTNYSATLTLTGATFQSPVTTATLTGQTGTCTPGAVTVVSGGGAGQTSVQVVFNVPNTCATTGANLAPNGVSFDTPLTLDAAASAASVSVGYNVVATGAAYGGANGTANLIQKAAGYVASVAATPLTATALPTQMALTPTPTYTTLVANSASADNILGSVKSGTATAGATTTGTIYANAAAATLPAITYKLDVSGDLAVIKAGAATSDANALAGTSAFALTNNTGNTIASSATGQTGNAAIYAFITGGNTTQVLSPKAYSATLTSSVGTSTTVAAPAAVTGALETVGLQGTNFIAPWFQLQSSTYNAILRLSNNSATATGPVSFTLRAGNGGSVNQTCTLTSAMLTEGTLVNGGIAANTAVSVSGRTIANACLGTTSTNADLQVTVQAQNLSLTAKVRVINPDSSVSETTLGYLDQTNFGF